MTHTALAPMGDKKYLVRNSYYNILTSGGQCVRLHHEEEVSGNLL